MNISFSFGLEVADRARSESSTRHAMRTICTTICNLKKAPDENPADFRDEFRARNVNDSRSDNSLYSLSVGTIFPKQKPTSENKKTLENGKTDRTRKHTLTYRDIRIAKNNQTGCLKIKKINKIKNNSNRNTTNQCNSDVFNFNVMYLHLML